MNRINSERKALTSEIRSRLIVKDIPEDLKYIPQWLPWVPQLKNDGQRFGKVPCNAQAYPTTWKAVQKWMTFDIAHSVFQSNQQIGGLGMVLTPSLGVIAVDIDDCIRDGVISSEVLWWVDKFNSYAELSVSLSGIHLLFSSKRIIPDAEIFYNLQRIEIFPGISSPHYLAVTGSILP